MFIVATAQAAVTGAAGLSCRAFLKKKSGSLPAKAADVTHLITNAGIVEEQVSPSSPAFEAPVPKKAPSAKAAGLTAPSLTTSQGQLHLLLKQLLFHAGSDEKEEVALTPCY